jgi:phosphonate transport system substrate-binding protein
MRKFRFSLMALMSLMVIGAFVLGACAPAATPEPVEEPVEEPMEEPTEEPMEEPEPEPELGSMEMPIKVLFVPSVDVDFMIASGDIVAQGLQDATGYYFEVSVPTSYAATIEEMCASPTDTIGFIPAMGYAVANQLCGVVPGLAAERRGWNVYWTQFLVQRDSEFETLADLDGASWAYPDATSTSGYLYPSVVFDDLGITPGEQVEAGGHPQAVRAVYNGEVDFATSFFSPHLPPEGRWSMDDPPDVPDDVVADCVPDEDGNPVCGGYTILDARLTIFGDAPDVIEKVRILGLSPEIVNDTMSFGPEFSEDLMQEIIDGVTKFIEEDPRCYESLCAENFYAWTGVGPIADENFDGIRLLMEAQGITLDTLGE